MAYNFLFSAYQDDGLSSVSERVEQMTQRIVEEMGSHLKYYWEASHDDEREVLQVLANKQSKVGQKASANMNGTGRLASELRGSADQLVKRSLVVARDGEIRPVLTDLRRLDQDKRPTVAEPTLPQKVANPNHSCVCCTGGFGVVVPPACSPLWARSPETSATCGIAWATR